MSGIYIPGLAMPEDGWHKVIKIFSDGTVVSYYDSVELAKAIPVPDHGRLIDKDVMCKECRRVAEEYDGIYPDCTYCHAHLAPTIIPAEEGQ